MKMLDENGNVIFNETEQKEVDRIIGERLARAKSEKPEDYDDLKEIASYLEEFGYGGSAAEKKEALRTYKEEAAKQKEIEALQQQAAETGTSPELLAELKSLKAELSDLKKDREERLKKEQAKQQEIEVKKQQEEKTNQQITELTQNYPDVNVDSLAKNEEFLEFVKDSNPNLSLTKIYERYIKFVGQAEDKAINKIQKNIDRSTSSGKAKGNVGETYGLTQRQQALAEENGISYKDYAMGLSLIKKG